MSNLTMLREKLAMMLPREGAAYSTREVQFVRDEIKRAETRLEPEAFFQAARERLEADHGHFGYTNEDIERAAGYVAEDWRASGRGMQFSFDDADALAAQVGNFLFNNGSSFDPTTNGQRREPMSEVGRQLEEMQREDAE